MKLLEMIGLQPKASVTFNQADPLDPMWYRDLSDTLADVDSGIYISAETVFRCAWVLAAVRFISTSVAMCTPQVFKETAGNRREQDREYYLHSLLRRPNAWMTGYRWRQQNAVWAAMWGNAYNRLVATPGQVVGVLEPIHPDRVTKVELAASGTSLVYTVRNGNGGRDEKLGSDEMLHFRGLSLDGLAGAPMYQLIRNAVAIALAAEKHLGTYLKKGSRLAGLITSSEKLDEQKRKDLRESWMRAYGGPDATGTAAVLPYGVKFETIAANNRESQFSELTDQQAQAIFVFLGVPGAVLGYTGNMTSTLPAMDAFYEKGGVKFAIQPWIENFEEEIDFSLIPEGDPHFTKLNMDVLVRSDFKTRIETLVKATGRPFLTGNEARQIEDLNPVEQGDMDEVAGAPGAQPVDAVPGDAPPAAPPPPQPKQRPAPNDQQAALVWKGRQFALDTAARVVRIETAAIARQAQKLASKPQAFKAWLDDFYGSHVETVQQHLYLDPDKAKAYSEGQREAVLAGGVGVIETWEAELPERLTALAYGD